MVESLKPGEYGWVDEHFHFHKVQYLESQNRSLRESNQAMRELLEKLRAKLVAQDEVLGKLAARSRIEG